jgi:hypothetical protein
LVSGVRQVLTTVGVAGEGEDDAGISEVRRGALLVTLTPRGERQDQTSIESAIRDALRPVPGARFTVSGGDLGEKLALILCSDDAVALDTTAAAVKRELRGIRGLSNITSTASLERPEIVVRPHLTLATEQGINTAAIGETVRFATTGDLDTQLPRLDLDKRQLYIRVRLPESVRQDPAALGNLRVRGNQGLIPLDRLDASVRRLLIVKFQLGLFDDPFVDPDEAVEVLGRADFVQAGRRAQAESMVLLHNTTVDGVPTLPLTTPLAVYAEGLPAEEAARLGQVVTDPAEADVAVVRLPAPFDPRDDLFLEGFFHQGSLEYRPGLVARLRDIAAVAPLVIDANLERPAILTPFTEFAAAILTDVGATSSALVEVLSGTIAPLGGLPFEVPRSTEAVRNSHSDVADDSEDPLYPHGAGLTYG